MARLSLLRIPKLGRRWRVDQIEGFEAQTQSASEDALRARRLRSQARVSALISAKRARKLARRLDRSARGIAVPVSMASSLYMRRQRRRIGAALWKLTARPGAYPQTFTLIPRGWCLTPEELATFNPKVECKAVRRRLEQYGAQLADGYLIMFVHGEYEPVSCKYQLHLHGIAEGGMVAVLDGLRQHRAFKFDASDVGRARHRIRISRKPLGDLPYPLTYLLKSFWPSRIRNVISGGSTRRSWHKRRVSEPFHSHYLLWLDRWSISDIAILYGVAVGTKGFFLTRRAGVV